MTKVRMPDPYVFIDPFEWKIAAEGDGGESCVTTDQAEAYANARIMQILEEVKRRSDSSYCRYIDVLQNKECLGFQYKVENGMFGENELKAHNHAHEFLGRHRAFSEVVSIIRALMPKEPK